MITEHKINEAKYNLKILMNTDPSTPEIHHALNNFLISCVSISYFLLEHYNKKYKLDLDYVDKKSFKEKAKNSNNQEAIDFIHWYADEYNKIEQKYEFLINKRRLTVHKDIVTPKSFRFVRDSKGNMKGLMSFEERPNEDMKIVCEEYLNRIEQFVYDTYKKFHKWH